MNHSIYKYFAYALDKNGNIVFIDDVKRGLACECFCPCCGQPLVAKQGNINAHHFAHKSGTDCAYGLETSLHIGLKERLNQLKTLKVPATLVWGRYSEANREIAPAQTLKFDKVELEKQEGKLIPDVIGYVGEQKYYIEIFVTHKVSDDKLKKFDLLGVPVLEIDANKYAKYSDAFTNQENNESFYDWILNNTDGKEWIYHPDRERLRTELLARSNPVSLIHRGCTLHIDDCPLHKRIYRGMSYANFYDDCLNCDRLIDVHLTNSVYEMSSFRCIGRVTEKEKKAPAKINYHNRREDSLSCPFCGDDMVLKNNGGTFHLACSQGEDCGKTKPINDIKCPMCGSPMKLRGCVDTNDQPRLECVWNHCLYVDSDGIHIDQYKPTNID